jgi:hypothetical protein
VICSEEGRAGMRRDYLCQAGPAQCLVNNSYNKYNMEINPY